MARPYLRPEQGGAWLREIETLVVHPQPMDPDDPSTRPYPPNAPKSYMIACWVAGRDGLVVVTWGARDELDARRTFLAWLSNGWAVLSQSFYGAPGPYVFRTAAIIGFVVLEQQRALL
jgi:hypothetical protein